MKNAVQLITYVDRLGGGNIHTLHQLLKGPLVGLFGGVTSSPFIILFRASTLALIPLIIGGSTPSWEAGHKSRHWDRMWI